MPAQQTRARRTISSLVVGLVGLPGGGSHGARVDYGSHDGVDVETGRRLNVAPDCLERDVGKNVLYLQRQETQLGERDAAVLCATVVVVAAVGSVEPMTLPGGRSLPPTLLLLSL